jgi:hypothetical protein
MAKWHEVHDPETDDEAETKGILLSGGETPPIPADVNGWRMKSHKDGSARISMNGLALELDADQVVVFASQVRALEATCFQLSHPRVRRRSSTDVPSRKKCTVCGTVKALGDYHKSITGIGGRRGNCKECHRKYVRARAARREAVA